MSMAEVFRRRADVTEQFAGGLTSRTERDRYLRLAVAFRKLADDEDAERGRSQEGALGAPKRVWR
jgi:hypothetical protein